MYTSIVSSSNEQIDRITAALPWLDAEDTPTWIKAITALKAVFTNFGGFAKEHGMGWLTMEQRADVVI